MLVINCMRLIRSAGLSAMVIFQPLFSFTLIKDRNVGSLRVYRRKQRFVYAKTARCKSERLRVIAECRAKCHTLYFYRNIFNLRRIRIYRNCIYYIYNRGKNEGGVYSAKKSEDAKLTSVRIMDSLRFSNVNIC